MLSVQSVIGCRLTFKKILRAELRGGLRAKLLRSGVGCGSGDDQYAGRGGLRAKL